MLDRIIATPSGFLKKDVNDLALNQGSFQISSKRKFPPDTLLNSIPLKFSLVYLSVDLENVIYSYPLSYLSELEGSMKNY